MLITRIAPTPSGYVHVGNAVNFVLTDWLARSSGGRLILRIDDFDSRRVRPQYLEDVFRTLEWLAIDVDEGPSGPGDFHSAWSHSAQQDLFRRARDQLLGGASDAVFVCRCSRRNLDPAGRCVAGCRGEGLALVEGHTALRVLAPTGSVRDLPVPPGDHVVWRRDGLPAYHLGSVVADVRLGVTAIVRGRDLRDSSALQLHLARLLDLPDFEAVDLRHHGLLLLPNGQKLSKSAGTQAQPLERTDRLREHVHGLARTLGRSIAVTPP